ncbi:MAG: magnesium transporter CorA family protein [Burkholderiaceae bacterium]|nr:magnesium transporter CorA family protein [Burkholderiaceae bacterium]
MRVFHITPDQFSELDALPQELPATGFVWIGSARREFEVHAAEIQARLQTWTGSTLVDLHVSDLLNNQLPRHFDTTFDYDLLVFRRLAAAPGSGALADGKQATRRATREALEAIDTSPVGFAVFDSVLVTVHPADCAVRDFVAARLAQRGQVGASRLPTNPADLMLRMVNLMVDSYLELRRLLSRQLGELQLDLLNPRSHFDDCALLLDARNRLHLLEDTCEDQRSAVQEWIDALDEWPAEVDKQAKRERELLRLRSRDVLEHVERVLGHVRRLEQSIETAVQMHFSALGHRTNNIMRTLTVLTAIFLPLNLITGFFGMNFDFLPLIHSVEGFWLAFATMVVVGVGLIGFFWRKRYLGSSTR